MKHEVANLTLYSDKSWQTRLKMAQRFFLAAKQAASAGRRETSPHSMFPSSLCFLVSLLTCGRALPCMFSMSRSCTKRLRQLTEKVTRWKKARDDPAEETSYEAREIEIICSFVMGAPSHSRPEVDRLIFSRAHPVSPEFWDSAIYGPAMETVDWIERNRWLAFDESADMHTTLGGDVFFRDRGSAELAPAAALADRGAERLDA